MGNSFTFRALAVAGLFVVSGLALAQDGGIKLPKRPAAGSNAKLLQQTVTQQEAAQIFERLEKLMKDVLVDMKPSATPANMPKNASPVTRGQVVRQLDRLFAMAQPVFRFTPSKVQYQKNVLQMKDPATKVQLEKLVSWGFVAKQGPLAVGPKDTLTVNEFGDAVGFFLARLAEVTHTPSSKFSPGLNGEG